MHTCHDVGVILGDVRKAACAGGTGFRVFSLGGAAGGSLTDPLLLDHVDVGGVTIGHSASWSWDGEVIIFGHEPGGGVAAECEATDDPVKKRFFFYDADTLEQLGTWTLPRAQGPTENCTLHNYDVTGAWSTYWYDGFLYESNIGEGLNIFKLSGNTLARRVKLGHLNPQTQEFSLPN